MYADSNLVYVVHIANLHTCFTNKYIKYKNVWNYKVINIPDSNFYFVIIMSMMVQGYI